jgi:hypothetical protein
MMYVPGSAIYIFGIVPNQVPNVSTLVDVRFLLDGEFVTPYRHEPEITDQIFYNVPLYVNQSLPHGRHELVIQPMAQPDQSIFVFDKAVVRWAQVIMYTP